MNDYFDSLCAATPARLQIGRTGSRYKTKSYLDFRAAHAAATDAVMTEVSQKTLDKLGLFEVKTKCSDKYEMLTRPDWGRYFDDDTKSFILSVNPGKHSRFVTDGDNGT